MFAVGKRVRIVATRGGRFSGDGKRGAAGHLVGAGRAGVVSQGDRRRRDAAVQREGYAAGVRNGAGGVGLGNLDRMLAISKCGPAIGARGRAAIDDITETGGVFLRDGERAGIGHAVGAECAAICLQNHPRGVRSRVKVMLEVMELLPT